MSLFQRVIFGFNVVAFFFTLLSCFTAYVDPSSVWVASLIAITFPAWICVNVLFVFYWLIAKPKNIFLSILSILLCFKSTQSVIQFNSHEVVDNPSIDIISYNSGGYGNGENLTWYKRIGVLEKLFLEMDADIYCLQENVDPLYELKGHENDLYEAHRFAKTHGCSIYSKFPMVKKGKIDFGLKTNSCVWADLHIGKDTIRIYNLHLKSNRIKTDEIRELQDINRDYKKNIKDTKGVLSKYGRLSGIRARQIKMVMENIENCPYRVIVCGDFNEPPQSYVYKQINKKLKDSFVEKGFGIDGTYAGKLPLLRIDYVFTDPSMDILSHETIKETKSDHFPVRVRIR